LMPIDATTSEGKMFPTKEHVVQGKARAESLDEIMLTYPMGFTLRVLHERYPDLYKTYRQASEFMTRMRKSDGRVTRQTVDGRAVYRVQQDPYKLLNKLWRIPHVE